MIRAILLLCLLLTVTIQHKIPLTIHRTGKLSHSTQLHHTSRHHLHLKHEKYQFDELNSSLLSIRMPLEVEGYEYLLSVDTGSSDIFIKGENIQGEPEQRYACGRYCIDNLPHVSVAYLDGPLETYADDLEIQFNNHTFIAQILVAYYTSSDNFNDSEGIVGLSYPSLARHQPTFIQTLINNNIIDRYAYGLNLNMIQPDRAFISFGSDAPEFYQGEITFYDIIQHDALWIRFSWARFADGPEMHIPIALLDTGNTCISIPRRFEEEMLEQFNIGGNYCVFSVEEGITMFSILLCEIVSFESLPELTINIEGTNFVVPHEYYIQACVKDMFPYKCETYIQSVESYEIILGDGFFNRFYMYVDLDSDQIGLAKNRENITLQDVLELNDLIYDAEDWVDFEE